MDWKVIFHAEFIEELKVMPEPVQDALLAKVALLKQYGPSLRRPHADTLKGGRYSNMKELRFNVGNEVWRVAYIFDPERKAVILAAAMKQGAQSETFL